MAAIIDVQNLEKKFNTGKQSVNAVQGVSFHVGEGEIYGLLGPNGAGKSTTVKMLVTLLAPSNGTATVAGYDIRNQTDQIRSTIGVALQDTGIDELQSGYELLYMHARLYGFSRSSATKRVSELIELVGLRDDASRRLKTYSGGMKRRLDLALALVHTPKIVFLDEPTTGLDPASRRVIWDEVENLRKNGVTILLTTQYLEEADQLADRIGIIDHGQLITEGTPDELKRQMGGDVIAIELAQESDLDVAAELFENAKIIDQQLRITVEDGAAKVSSIVSTLNKRGIQPETLMVQRPTLDDVFLKVTRHQSDQTKEN